MADRATEPQQVFERRMHGHREDEGSGESRHDGATALRRLQIGRLGGELWGRPDSYRSARTREDV